MKSLKLFLFLLLIFSLVMAIRQSVNDEKEYYTIVKVIFNNGAKKEFKEKGRPSVYLENGDLQISGNIRCSNVNSFEWNIYKLKK